MKWASRMMREREIDARHTQTQGGDYSLLVLLFRLTWRRRLSLSLATLIQYE